MNKDKIAKLENNIKFKKKIFSKGVWKNYAIFPPVMVIFTGILGVVYLLNNEKIMSLYAIPFALIFVLGTIWLKSVRRYLIAKNISDNQFQICMTIPFLIDEKKKILMFSIGDNRNNKYYLEKEKKDILEKRDIDISTITQKPFEVEGTDLFLIRLTLSKKILGSIMSNYWVVYTGLDSVYFLTQQDLDRY